MIFAIVSALVVMALAGAGYVLVDAGNARSQKRFAALGKPANAVRAGRAADNLAAQRTKKVQAQLKEIDKRAAEKKEKLTTKRRLEMAGFGSIPPRTFWLICAGVAVATMLVCFLSGQALLVTLMAGFGAGFGLPRWVLTFLKNRREKKFTNEFANAIDVIVRSVRSGLPTNEALKIVAREMPEPVCGEFNRLCEGLKVGITLEQGLKKMYESMPTAEVSFFGIVMTIQGKAGGNLSEALSNLSSVLRDRKRLAGKIKAMSSEAKASAGIIGSLPPAVMGIVYATTPHYISLLFTERLGNLMLAGCAFWMGCGIFVMRKMINFKH